MSLYDVGQPVPFCKSDFLTALLHLLPSLRLSFQPAQGRSPKSSSSGLQALTSSELRHFMHPNIGNTNEQRLL